MQADKLSVAFIGAGNMAQAMIQGLVRMGLPGTALRAADPSDAARRAASNLGAATFTDVGAAIAGADVVVLAVKPQVAGEVVRDLRLAGGQLLLSIAAGIDLGSLASWLAPRHPVVRCMPNTPALLGAGMSAMYANEHVTPLQREFAAHVLQAAGETVWVDNEKALDAVTAVSGSGPAYFFLLMEKMIEAGTDLGLTAELARTLTVQTAYGAALMARDSTRSPAELRNNVTSPGGTTEAALQVMQEGGVGTAIVRAIVAAEQRATELAAEFGAST